MNKIGIIYKITNLVNNKCYIGQTVNLNKRIEEHFSGRRTKTSAICSAIKKYGKENFRVDVLYQDEISKLDELEIYYIKIYNTLATTGHGYNLHSGGQVKRIFSEETRKKMSLAQIGHKRSSETIEKHRKKLLGKKHTKEHIEKSVSVRQKPIKVICLKTGKELYFNSVLSATILNISQCSIIKALKKTGKSKGYLFYYISKDEYQKLLEGKLNG